MCGIAGYYSFDKSFSNNDLRFMAAQISHRGPDAEGYFSDEIVGLAHKRLSIIDLSSSANQPMYSHCRNFVIVLNGEIYNYRTVRSLLEREHNVKFVTQSDTEVVLEGFAVWGYSVFEKLAGMFALGIYDIAEKALYLCRDRIGIKPIYLYKNETHFAFASEIKALSKLPSIKRNLCYNNDAFGNFLHLGYIPQPHTVYKEISKFPSGHWAKIKDNEIEYFKYWSVSEKIASETINDLGKAEEILENLLIEVIKEHLICDVPFGAFLSGGIDSSLVTAIASKLTQKPLNTFSIGFSDSKYDESIYAKKIAQHLNTNHHELFVNEQDAFELIPSLIDIYDEPYADSSAIPSLLLSKMAKKNVSVALSGDGGDELFLGYGAYHWAKRLNNPFVKILHKPISDIFSSQKNSRFKRIGKMFDLPHTDKIPSHIFSQEQYFFTEKELCSILNTNFSSNIDMATHFPDLNRKLDAIETQSIFDINHYLKDDLLVKVDKASMQHALEVRVPLLDHRLIEFAINTKTSLRLKNGNSKYLLKKVLYKHIPESFFNRPKWGFSIPLESWMKTKLKPFIFDFLSESIVSKHNVVNNKEVENLLHNFYNKKEYGFLYNRLWALALLHQFLEKE